MITQELKDRRIQIQNHLKKIELELKTLSLDPSICYVDEPIDSTLLKSKCIKLQASQQALNRQIAMIDMQIKDNDNRLHRLHYWLSVETIGGISTIAIVQGSYSLINFLLVPLIWCYSVLILAALMISPLILKAIFQEGRFGWLIGLMVMVGLPCFLLLVPTDKPSFVLAFQLFPLLMFYLFCVFLRDAVKEWLEY